MSKIRPYIFVLIPIIVLILLRIPSLFESYWYGDEGIYAAVSTELARGKALYSQTWDHKPPLIFWAFFPSAVIGWSKGFIVLRFINIILGVLTLIAAEKILKTIKVKGTIRFISLMILSILLGLPILEGNIFNAEVIFMVFNIFFLLLLLKSKYLLLAGFLAFLSLVTKVPGFVEIVLIAVVFGVVWIKEKKGIKFIALSTTKIAAGFITPMILLISYFAVKGTLGDFYYANLAFNQIYSLQEASFIEISNFKIPSNYLQAISVVLVFVTSFCLYWTKKLSAFSFLTINLFTVQLFASLLSAKNYGHYFLQVLTSVTFLVALIMQTTREKISLKNGSLIILFILLLSPLFYTLKKGGEIAVYAKPTEYYSLFVNGFIRNDEVSKNKFWWKNGDGVIRSVNTANYLETTIDKESSVYIYTSQPWVIALADVNFTNKYVVWFHLQYLEAHLDEDMVNIKNSDYFVLDTTVETLPKVQNEIQSSFEKIDTFENFDIFINNKL